MHVKQPCQEENGSFNPGPVNTLVDIFAGALKWSSIANGKVKMYRKNGYVNSLTDTTALNENCVVL